ncbi:hypothetical protein K431DRAFT_305076 [Polychaeton citri CBS 116435]|uniref:Uncharacterized protein n=1 Tax=Polychaeton citri CBS 116435 TaxID=1314669 RepID=A0A9P4UNB8_9PEZI|nr:hypothetical protein K431DRAFT_305076 [Polychaeton citri CBS 116435]
MASVYSLPAPIPLFIAKLLPDLKALDALRQSCSLFAVVFARHAVELLEHVMLATLHEDTIVELRTYVLVSADRRRWQQTEGAMEHLHANANAPLDRGVSIEAVSLALRAFSALHSLCSQVVERKFDELYGLPHQHPTTNLVNRSLEYLLNAESVAYDVPTPWPVDWIEEQRILQALFHLRSCALLGQDPDRLITRPGRRIPGFSLVHECSHLFDACVLEIVRRTTVLPQQSDWQAPAATPLAHCDPSRRHVHDEFCKTSWKTYGWLIFHAPLCHVRPTPFTPDDWPVFRELGLGVWSRRRLEEDLELGHRASSPLKGTACVREDGGKRHACSHEIIFTWWILYKAQRSCSASC